MKRLLMLFVVFVFIFNIVEKLSSEEKKQKPQSVIERSLCNNEWKWETKDFVYVYQFRTDKSLSTKMHRKGIEKEGDFFSSASFYWDIKEGNILCLYIVQGEKDWTLKYCIPGCVSKIKITGDILKREFLDGGRMYE